MADLNFIQLKKEDDSDEVVALAVCEHVTADTWVNEEQQQTQSQWQFQMHW